MLAICRSHSLPSQGYAYFGHAGLSTHSTTHRGKSHLASQLAALRMRKGQWSVTIPWEPCPLPLHAPICFLFTVAFRTWQHVAPSHHSPGPHPTPQQEMKEALQSCVCGPDTEPVTLGHWLYSHKGLERCSDKKERAGPGVVGLTFKARTREALYEFKTSLIFPFSSHIKPSPSLPASVLAHALKSSSES